MALYLVQGSYSSSSVAAMVAHPTDRAAAIRTVLKRMGGKLQGMWFSFGEFDVVAVIELPDNVDAAAVAMAIGATGSVADYRTTPLLTTAQAKEAMEKAAGAGYKPPA